MGVGPLISWRKASFNNLFKNFLYPISLAIFTVIVLLALGMKDIKALVAFALCAFVTGTVFTEFIRGTRVRIKRGENFLLAFMRLVSRNKRRYGGYIVHIGIVLIVIGVTASSVFVTEKQATLNKGESLELRNYSIRFDGLKQYTTDAKNATIANLTLFEGGNKIDTITPEKNIYKYEGNREINQETEVALRSTYKDDLYVILSGFNTDGSATIRAMINPMVSWIWAGGLVLLLGAVVTMWPSGRKSRQEAFVRYTVSENDTTVKAT